MPLRLLKDVDLFGRVSQDREVLNRIFFFFALLFPLSFFALTAEAKSSHRKKPRGLHHTSRPATVHHYNGLSAKQRILLTFDDGPEITNTPKLLDILDKYGVKAIFFVNGYRFRSQNPQAEKAREVLREIVRRGHFVGNHTMTHPFLCGPHGPEIAEKEVVDNALLIEEVIGVPPPFFRTPFGSRCAHLTELYKRLNIDPIHWNVDPEDWKLRDRYKNLAAIQEGLNRLLPMQKPVIILMHDVQPETVETVPLLLDWLATKPNFTIAHPIEIAPKVKAVEQLKPVWQPMQKLMQIWAKPWIKQP